MLIITMLIIMLKTQPEDGKIKQIERTRTAQMSNCLNCYVNTWNLITYANDGARILRNA